MNVHIDHRRRFRIDARQRLVNPSSRSARCATACVKAIESLERRTFLSAGLLDPTFGGTGIVTTEMPGSNTTIEAHAVAVQSDGKVLVGGKFLGLSAFAFQILRYNVDGTLDTTFGDNGHVRTTVPLSTGYLYALAVQADGKILAGGGGSIGGTLVRYLPNGTLDASFGDAGFVQGVLGFSGNVKAIKLQADGMIVIGGTQGAYMGIARYQSNGAVDSTFANGGITPAVFNTGCSGVTIQDNGKIVAVDGNLVVRYNPDGSADNTFDRDGALSINASTFGYASGVTITADQRIVVGGTSTSRPTLVKLLDDGSFDTSFGDGGVAVGPSIAPLGAYTKSLVQQADGKLIVSAQNSRDFVLVGFAANGSLDLSFGTAGVATTDFGTADETARALALAPGSKIVAAGYDTNSKIIDVARYSSTGALDPTFGIGGMTSYTATISDASATSTVIQQDGKILVSGTGGHPAIVRYLPNGELDPTFGIGGTTGLLASPSRIALQSTGSIIVASGFTLTRYNPNGSLDTSFGNGGQTFVSFNPNASVGFSDMIVLADDRIRMIGTITYHVTQGVWYTGFATAEVPANGDRFVLGGQMNLGDNYSEGSATYGRYADGRFLLAGRATNTTTNKIDLVVDRYLADGTRDNQFGTSGRVLLTNQFDTAYNYSSPRVAGLSDGKVVLGITKWVSGNYDFWFAELTAAGALDTSFGASGTTTVDFNAAPDQLASVLVDSSNRIVASGSTGVGGAEDFALVRMMSDGQLDSTFGINGRTVTDLGMSGDTVSGMALQANGKIVVAGSKLTMEARTFAVARYMSELALEAPDLTAQSDSGWFTDDNVTNVTAPAFEVAAVVPGATLTLYRDGSAVQVLSNTIGGTVLISDPGPVSDGTHSYAVRQADGAGTQGLLSPPVQVTIDTALPIVTSKRFDIATAPMSMTWTWSENVSFVATDMTVVNQTTGFPVPEGYQKVEYDGGVARFAFAGFANGILPDGHYQATFANDHCTDAAGNPLIAPDILTFRVLAGDADGDGVVNFSDYALIDFGFNNHLIGWSNGDFNGDGVVNYDDYAIIDFAFNQQTQGRQTFGDVVKVPKPVVVARPLNGRAAR